MVGVEYDGEKSDGDYLTLFIVLTYGNDINEFRTFEASNTLPLLAVLKRCLFDLEGFAGEENMTYSAFREALDYALNALGSLEFYIENGVATAKFTFYNHYVYFVLDKENTAFFFERT